MFSIFVRAYHNSILTTDCIGEAQALHAQIIAEQNRITRKIIGAAFSVHRALRPGLLEHVYQACLRHELSKVSMKIISELTLPVIYDGIRIDLGYCIDLLVEDEVIVELKRALHVVSIEPYTMKPVPDLLRFAPLHIPW